MFFHANSTAIAFLPPFIFAYQTSVYSKLQLKCSLKNFHKAHKFYLLLNFSEHI